MKKESKSYKVLNSRFILLVILILLMANKMYGQCENTAICNQSPTVKYIAPTDMTCPTYETDYLDIAKTGITTPDINITQEGFSGNPVTLKVVNITIFIKKGTNCTAQPGTFTNAEFLTATGINFIEGGSVNISGTPDIDLRPKKVNGEDWVTYINFTVKVIQNNGEVGSRKFFFRVPANSGLWGDTHITTVDGVKYDFQAVGEFVALRGNNGDNFEIQTRQTAVATASPATDNYSGLRMCVSVNTAVAARVGTHRITYEPIVNGNPDASGMQLRVDGVPITLTEDGLDLGSGGSVIKLPPTAPTMPGRKELAQRVGDRPRYPAWGGAIEINFPNRTSLVVVPHLWFDNQWYLDLSINNTTASEGISGVIPEGSWLPALPDGTSIGPMPNNLHDRFLALYKTFADAWRVTDQTSLFDYDRGRTSTTTFTDKNWPAENSQSCIVPGQTALTPIGLQEAERLSSGILDPNMKANAILDVMVTGETKFAQGYLDMQQILNGTTATTVIGSKDVTKLGETVTFTARVFRKFLASSDMLKGTVSFTADGVNLGQVTLDPNGVAVLSTTSLKLGRHQIVALFTPDLGSTAFYSKSTGIIQTVNSSLASTFSISLHGGRTFPIGDFGKSYRSGWLGEIDAEYHFSRHFSTELVGGYYNFDSSYKVIGATLYANAHASLGSFDGYLGAGPGFYKPDNVLGSFGASGKIGLQRPVTSKLWVDLNGAYFKLFGKADGINFFTASLGVKIYF